ncbi:hypothetical protein V6N13_036981 [Hibiscus sabdariffa]
MCRLKAPRCGKQAHRGQEEGTLGAGGENFEGRRGERFHVNGTCTWPEVGSSGRKSTAHRVVSGAPPAALENPEDRVPFASGRTHNLIRSPR